MYWYANKLYGWAMSQRLDVHNFEWKKAHHILIEVDFEYP